MYLIKPINIKAWEFNELLEEAQKRVINEHIDFWIEVREYNSDFPGNYEKAVDMAKENGVEWFLESYVLEYCKDEIIEEIKANDYLFNEDGIMLPILKQYKPNNESKLIWGENINSSFEIVLEQCS